MKDDHMPGSLSWAKHLADEFTTQFSNQFSIELMKMARRAYGAGYHDAKVRYGGVCPACGGTGGKTDELDGAPQICGVCEGTGYGTERGSS